MQFKAWKDKKADAAVLMKLAITAACVVGMAFHFAFPDRYAAGHLLFHFSHANVFHLLANLMCLWMMRFPIKWGWAFGFASLASLVPSPTWSWGSMSFEMMPTCGLSGMLFAAIAIAFAEKSRFREMCKFVVIPILVTGLMPNVNMLYHLWAVMVAYWGWKLKKILR